MKISYNWLNDVIATEKSPQELERLLTGSGLEVEGLETYQSIRGGLKGVVVGEVKTCERHPNADKLSVTTVDIGTGELLHIVCGAPNVAAGQKVLVATVGTTLYPSGGAALEIRKSKIRGEVSEGMLCAEDELGLGQSHAGILVLPDHYKVGDPASTYFPVYEDYLIEIGLTANRGDAASHLGVARDLKALTGEPVRSYQARFPTTQAPCPIAVEVKDTAGCKRYSGLYISGIQVKESPDWLKHRLGVIGIHPINNIVDATNYVLHEMGQPLHAFDAGKLRGKRIEVKQCAPGTMFTTLDQEERKLNGSECMICDGEGPIAIAGVFGGLHSGITQSTTDIFIESAYFDPGSIRKTARQHGLSTDASFRYERGTDPEITLAALSRVADIIVEIAGGRITGQVVDSYPEPIIPAIVTFSVSRFHALIGHEIPVARIREILLALDIKIEEKSSDEWLLTVPAYRSDVKRPADIAEEILRIYGLNEVPVPAMLKSVLTRSADEDAYLLRNRIADFLSAAGFSEMVCNSLTRSAYYTEDELTHAVKMLNPLSSDLDIMRISMLFNGLEMIQYNANRRSKNIKSFEFGYTYAKHGNGYAETAHFSLFVTGMLHEENWKQKQEASDIFYLKSMVRNLLHKAGLQGLSLNYAGSHPQLHNAITVQCQGKEVAVFGAVRSAVLKQMDIDQAVYYADINWEMVRTLLQTTKFSLRPISSFPSVRRDLALLLDQAVAWSQVEELALKAEPTLIRNINLFDVYEGEKIAAGKKSYALSVLLQDDEKTLTDQDIDAVMNRLVKKFTKELGAELRA